jgi:hypothetical protein
MMRYFALIAPLVLLLIAVIPATSEAAMCGPDVMAALRSPGAAGSRPVELDCDVTLSKRDIVTVPIAFSGAHASGATLDCGGGTLDGTVPKGRTVLIRSMQGRDGRWDVPQNIRIRNCTIKGDLRIQGMGGNGQAEKVKASSLQPGHVERAQAAAPSRIILSNINFVANDVIPLYLAPGVTDVTVENSHFSGKVSSTVVYLDAESARNRIVGNTFDTDTSWREVIAVDGSADNLISRNTFLNPVKGGIFLYRNCGEGGAIRHQPPQHNIITDNDFRYKSLLAAPAVWLGSRQGISPYCIMRPTSSFGSGASALDFAQYNKVTGNRLTGGLANFILDNDKNNIVSNNK